MANSAKYIWEQKNWPEFTWDLHALLPSLSEVRFLQGKLKGKMEGLGIELLHEAELDAVSESVIKSSAIEGEILNPEEVRSSVAKQLGIHQTNKVKSPKNVDGFVALVIDATRKSSEVLNKERLFAWHKALFPTGNSGHEQISTGKWRNDKLGRMRVISGPMGKEKIHFLAPPAAQLPSEMKSFLAWLNTENNEDPVLKAAIAQLWFLTLHPFDDGNGRIARAISDFFLAKSDGISLRYYSMSSQIEKEKKTYYEILEKTQKGSLDITPWIAWFLKCLNATLVNSGQNLAQILFKHNFWFRISKDSLNTRQIKVLEKLLGNFEGNLTTTKWSKITKCSQDTALRDIQDLVERKILKKHSSGGRSTHYILVKSVK